MLRVPLHLYKQDFFDLRVIISDPSKDEEDWWT